MFKPSMLVIVVVFILSSFSFAGNTTSPKPLLDAIYAVESSSGTDTKDGDGGKAIGPYQIWWVYWKDATDYDPSIGGTYQDCRNKEYAEKIINAYWRRWCPEALANSDFEVLARIHNGGWNGMKKESTIKYWRKIQKHLQN